MAKRDDVVERVKKKKMPNAPNGEPYDPHDVAYYMSLGYTYHDAIEICSTSDRYRVDDRPT